jgi:uncharacterized membrane protein
MSGFYIGAGVYHFVNPRFFLKIIPTYIPLTYHSSLVYISGILEIIFGAMLIPESTRPLGAWLLIALLIGVFLANIQMSVTFWKKKNPYFWSTIARLPLQIVLIWWAWRFTHN